jgi:hypothetical protein
MNICTVEVELFHVDEQRDISKRIVAFRNFGKARVKKRLDRRDHGRVDEHGVRGNLKTSAVTRQDAGIG